MQILPPAFAPAALAGVVALAHHPAAFMGLLLLFMGIATAYPQFQDRLILREGLLVAFFLAGLVVLGGQQQWWLEPLLHSMDDVTVYFGATALTAITSRPIACSRSARASAAPGSSLLLMTTISGRSPSAAS